MILSSAEILVVAGIVILISLECSNAIRSRSWIEIYRPTLFVAVILVFYTLLGPLRAVLLTGEEANFVGTSGTFYRQVEHRPFLIWGWLGALFFYASFLVGYHFHRPSLKPRRFVLSSSLSYIRKTAIFLCWLGFLPYLLVNGDKAIGMLNPFWPEGFHRSWIGFSGIDVGLFENYFLLSINLLIPGIVIQFAIWLRQRRHTVTVFLWTIVASSIYLSEAFRYRILLLLVPILLLWLFYNKKRPKLILLVAFMLIFIGINGALSIARTNSFVRGINITAVTKFSPAQVFSFSFEEAGAFLTTSAMISAVPDVVKFSQFEPLLTGLLQPIPRKIFPSKPDGSYSTAVKEYIYGTPDSYTAYLNYAEYYISFGWAGVLAASALMGILFKRMWVWFLWRQFEPLPQAIYLLNAAFLFVIISRGYFPQVLMLYGFTILPSFVIYYLIADHK